MDEHVPYHTTAVGIAGLGTTWPSNLFEEWDLPEMSVAFAPEESTAKTMYMMKVVFATRESANSAHMDITRENVICSRTRRNDGMMRGDCHKGVALISVPPLTECFNRSIPLPLEEHAHSRNLHQTTRKSGG